MFSAFCIIFGLYIVYCLVLMRFYVAARLSVDHQELNTLQEEYQQLVHAKEDVSHDKLHVADESMKILTLFEIAKEITKSLNEKQAFDIFKQKLKDNIQMMDCLLLGPEENIDAYRDPARYFVYTLRIQKRKIGHLVIEGVQEEEKDEVFILCHQYALALQRVRLYQEIERTAITDGLTGLHTRRYTLERLEEEIARSKERQIQLAFLMMDVDHFKNFNDTYGHLTGDQILREVGRLIRGNIREIDIAGRFGGEEFCVLLPDTDLDGARYAAERIRHSVEGTQIQAYDNTVRVTISVGIAIYPKDAKKGEELVDKSDWTLYKAKKQGRNRVCAFNEN